jgi:hypothetical protein
MLKSPGWARIDKWLQNEVKSLYSELLHASEPTMIIRIQQKIMAIEGIVNTIKSFEEESKLLAEQRNGSRT